MCARAYDFAVVAAPQIDALVREVGVLRENVITYHEFVAATFPRTVYLDVSTAAPCTSAMRFPCGAP